MIELLALMIIVYVPIFIGNILAKTFGIWAGIGVGVLAAVTCMTAVILFYRASGRRHEKRRRELREKYLEIYRVVSIPEEGNITKQQGAEIKVSDYGWEAEPQDCRDGFIYLQGLTDKWQVVLYAGFRPDQIEKIGLKPRSQYDWDYSWLGNAPPCPFPIQKRETASMGLPDVWGWNGSKRKK